MYRGGMMNVKTKVSGAILELRRTDALWMLLIFCQSLVLGLSSFYLTYVITSSGLWSLVVATLVMLALTSYWVWVTLDRG